MSNDNSKFSIWQPIAIPLEGFQFVHSPFGETTRNVEYLFTGRDSLIDRLLCLISDARKRGSYLLAGYRGVGKTSIVNSAIDRYKNSPDAKAGVMPIIVRINLGDNSRLTPLDIYFSIANILLDELKDQNWFCPNRLFSKWICPGGKMLDELVTRMGNEISETRTIGSEFGSHYGPNIKLSGYTSSSIKPLPISVRDAEERLLKIIQVLSKSNKRKIIFIFDEIDKLSHTEVATDLNSQDVIAMTAQQNTFVDKNTKINTLLGSLKNFITTAEAIFFFISGRETLDKYYSEKGSPNSLYESLFDQVFEVPSLLTDKKNSYSAFQMISLIEEYLCCRLISQESTAQLPREESFGLRTYRQYIRDGLADNHPDTRLLLRTLRNFVYYLTFHSWGNPKRLAAIFESFVITKWPDGKETKILKARPGEPKYWLYFDISQLRAFALAAELTTLFQHQFSREVSKISDKLTVTSLASLQFILKHHSYGFSRGSLHHMSEAMNVHRSPAFNSIVDDLLTQTFKSYIRRIRNGVYRYRFHSGFEQELRYISHTAELESAAYNFSLDSMRQVKQFFHNILATTHPKEKGVIWRAHISLGDICALEQSYNESAGHYCAAIRLLKQEVCDAGNHVSEGTLMTFIEVMMKNGDLDEHRQNYPSAAAIYADAKKLVDEYVTPGSDISKYLLEGDSKWDMLKQPIWAGLYLSLKRSPRSKCVNIGADKKDSEMNGIENFYNKTDPRLHFRLATLAFFSGDFECARSAYEKTIENVGSSVVSSPLNERTAYLRGNAVIGIAETFLVCASNELFKMQLAEDDNTPVYYDSLLTILKYQFPDTTNISDKKYFHRRIVNRFVHPVRMPIQKRSRLGRELCCFDCPTRGKSNLYKLVRCPCMASRVSRPSCSLFQPWNTALVNFSPIINIVDELYGAAKLFEKNRIYISAAITHMKTISYLSTMLDAFDQRNASELTGVLEKFPEKIIKIGKAAIRCINKARKLESSQSNKTQLVRDYYEEDYLKGENVQITQLFDALFDWDRKMSDIPLLKEQITWQHGLWAHKLVVILVWARYVYQKVKGDIDELAIPPDLSTFSVRPAIMLRWLYARELCRRSIEGKLFEIRAKGTCRYTPYNRLMDVFKSCGSKNDDVIASTAGKEFTMCFSQEGYSENQGWPSVLEDAYKISRNLYFSLSSIRIISRRNMDLIFPRMSQIYFIQWKLLVNLAAVMLVDREDIYRHTGEKIDSVRSVSFLLQRKLHEIDERQAKHERIPPSHFDYEYVYLRLCELLDSAISLTDQTSRARVGIFQNKYYCHDDYTDAEFHMDYILANMFTPSAVALRYLVINTQREFEKVFDKKSETHPEDAVNSDNKESRSLFQ